MNSAAWRMALLIVFLFGPTAAFAGSQTYTSPGSFTVPSYATLTVTLWGAGGGGGTSYGGYTCGTAGGTSSFSGVSAGGGSPGTCYAYPSTGGAGGTASGGTVNTSGNAGQAGSVSTNTYANGPGSGGNSPNGGAGGSASWCEMSYGECGVVHDRTGPSAPGGGGTAGEPNSGAGGGGGGAYASKTYAAGDLTPGSSISVTVGTGGSGAYAGVCPPGNNCAGLAGARGEVQITWTEPTLTINANVTVNGNLNTSGALSKGSGSFVIDHPLDPKNKLLYHSFVESPDALNIYTGSVRFDSRGEAVVELPEYFLVLNRDSTYRATPIGEPMPNLYVKKEVRRKFLGLFGRPVFVLAGGAAFGEASWMVTGVRKDPYIIANPIIPEVWKGNGAPYAQGMYAHPELYKNSQ